MNKIVRRVIEHNEILETPTIITCMLYKRVHMTHGGVDTDTHLGVVYGENEKHPPS